MSSRHNTDPRKPVLVLFRSDLRISDNRALSAAAETGKPVLPVFILDELGKDVRIIGAARRWWLHHSLAALGKSIGALGGRLLLCRGKTPETVDALLAQSGADLVLWNRRYVPAETEIDGAMTAELRARGLAAGSFDGHLLHEPSMLKTGSGGFYRVYTPFWKALTAQAEPRDPVDPPKALKPFGGSVDSDCLDDWELLPSKPDWSGGLAGTWTPGEAAAHERLDEFLDGMIEGYGENRDVPGIEGTSRLSPHLAHGEITPFQIFSALRSRKIGAGSADIEKFRKEIGWREFSYHLLFYNPDLATKNFNSDFDRMKWLGTAAELEKWRRGKTGYPLVDAGMRELWATGWMHNRVRMVVASFLIKHLLIDWRDGEKWFWDTLVDADPANNTASWQWVAGSGADAAPYFRVFNPVLQSEKFDPDGTYIRRYVPELAELPDAYLHKPWEAPEHALLKAGVKLGTTYPVPVIDHQKARQRALQAYDRIKGN